MESHQIFRESDATSVTSSSGLKTPEISAFTGGTNVSITSDADLSFTTIDNPAISSMEVEVNDSYDKCEALDYSEKSNSPYISHDPATPQRASQIFNFLTKKQSKPPIDCDRTLPDLPSCFSSPSEEGVDCHRPSVENRNSLVPIPYTRKRFSAPPIPFDNDTQRSSLTLRQDIHHSQELHSTFSDDSHDCQYHPTTTPFNPQTFIKQTADGDRTKRNDVKVLMSGPTRVILTAPTPGTNRVGSSRLLSGPRPLLRKSSSGSVKKRRSILGEVQSNSATILGDPFLIISPKHKPQRNRRSSASSIRSFSSQEYERNENYISHPKKPRPSSPAHSTSKLKGNQLSLSIKNDLPSTPLRSNTNATSRSHFRKVGQSGKMRLPILNPNLSSELSPVGRQIMEDVRHQRTRARETGRARIANKF